MKRFPQFGPPNENPSLYHPLSWLPHVNRGTRPLAIGDNTLGDVCGFDLWTLAAGLFPPLRDSSLFGYPTATTPYTPADRPRRSNIRPSNSGEIGGITTPSEFFAIPSR